MKNVKIYNVEYILNELKNCIKNKLPFSLIRLGDGGLKFLDCVLKGKINKLNSINEKEGIPNFKIMSVFKLWQKYASEANFIDSSQVYYNNKFWSRIKGPKKKISKETDYLLKNWKDIYFNSQFNNNRYCNPEVNFLMCIRRLDTKSENLLDILKNKKICIISTYRNIGNKLLDLSPYIDTIRVVKQYENQYHNNFRQVCKILRKESNNYDIFLVAAGELGRIYIGLIKEMGGRALDIGSIVDSWITMKMPVRLQYFLIISYSNPLEFRYLNRAKKYLKYI